MHYTFIHIVIYVQNSTLFVKTLSLYFIILLYTSLAMKAEPYLQIVYLPTKYQGVNKCICIDMPLAVW